MPNQAKISPSWKEEVNQRVAAHKNRKPNASPEPDAASQHHAGNKKAAAAAARVAARFAKAPSYSDALADEARAAVRAAEAVSRAALEAQAKAESVLAELEAAQEAETHWELHSSADAIPGPHIEQRADDQYDDHYTELSDVREVDYPDATPQSYQVRWDSGLRIRQADPAEIHERHGAEPVENEAGEWNEPNREWQANGVEMVEPALPIHANLIEFPREIVATRKMRPRRIEGPYAESAEQGAQLSIFEVDPAVISTDPAEPAIDDASSAAWKGPEWSGMQLGAQPETEYVSQQYREEPQPHSHYYVAAHNFAEQAPLSLRIMAAVVDFALMLAAFVAAAWMAGHHAKDLPSLRATEVGTLLGLIVVGALYRSFFYALGNGTPGMKYAGIALCTFEGHEPLRPQRFKRLAALLLSVLPVGVGVLWALFDDDHLSWHDRLSQTYLRRT